MTSRRRRTAGRQRSIGLAAIITFTQSWPAVGKFFVRWGFLGSYTWSLVPTAIAGIAGFFVLRRATPKS